MNPKPIQDNVGQLRSLQRLLRDYGTYIRRDERQPLAANVIDLVRQWVADNLSELEPPKNT